MNSEKKDDKDIVKHCIINKKQYLKEKRFICKKDTYSRSDGMLIERSCKVPTPFDSIYEQTAKEICNYNQQGELSIINKLIILESIISILRTKDSNILLKYILLKQISNFCIRNNLQDFLSSILTLLNFNLI